ncbi:MAG: DEAD/DEAH box helicase, partial [Thermoleophilia bacterium]|nr:DEAD/DEAH box helicase [Thermoleophilia bacterium]
EVGVVEVETQSPSPFASSLLFEYVQTYMYEGDAPVAERRAQALALDRDLLRELLGRDEMRELIDPGALESVEDDLQGRSERSRARDADGLHDLLRRVGDLAEAEVAARITAPREAAAWLETLAAERRGARIRLAGEERWIAAEDAGRYRDGLGVMPPSGLPGAFLESVDDALTGLVARYARTHGPFPAGDPAERFGIARGAAEAALAGLEAAGTVVRGEMRPGGSGREWCDTEVLRRLRRASLAVLRREVEPADPAALGRFLPAWHGIDRPPAVPGADALRDVIGRLQGVALPAAQWEGETLPRRLGAYSPSWLDQLAAAGEVVWVGAGQGRVALYLRDDAPLLGAPAGAADLPQDDPVVDAVAAALDGGALFWDDLLESVEAPREELFAALWALVWAGRATNDLWAPLRAPRRRPAAQARPPRPGTSRLSMRRGPARGGMAAVAGRWSLAERLFTRGAAPPADRRRAHAELLLERHGVVTRGAVLAEGVPGGFSGVYQALGDLETVGMCRRGYFVEGLGGAQFALPGAVERLRDLRDRRPGEPVDALVIGAADPAQPYGAALPWPQRQARRSPSRVHGAQVVLLDGSPAVYVERGGRSLTTFRDPDPEWTGPALEALAAWVRADRSRRLLVERVDGEPVTGTPWAELLASAGFRVDLKGMLLRA